MAVIGTNRYGNIISTGGASVKGTTDKTYKKKKRSSGGSSRVIYKPSPTQPGGEVPTERIDVSSSGKGTYTDLKTGAKKEFVVRAGTSAADVAIPEKGIKSQVQKAFDSKKISQERVILAKTESGKDIVRARVQKAGDYIKITDEKGVRYERANNRKVEDITLPYAKSYKEQRYEKFQKTGKFQGTLLDYQTYVAEKEGRATRISGSTALRSGLPAIILTEDTTPQEFKKQRETALRGYGDKVIVESRPKKYGKVNYPKQTRENVISELMPAPKRKVSDIVKGKGEKFLSELISKGKYRSFDELKAGVEPVDFKSSAREFYNLQTIPGKKSGILSYLTEKEEKLSKKSTKYYDEGKNIRGFSYGVSSKVVDFGKYAAEKPVSTGLLLYGGTKLLNLGAKGLGLITTSEVAAKAYTGLSLAAITGYNVMQEETKRGKFERAAADVVLIGAFAGTSKIKSKVQDVYVGLGSTEIPQEAIFAESVLSGKETLPTTKSVKESVLKFELSNTAIEVKGYTRKSQGKKVIVENQELASNVFYLQKPVKVKSYLRNDFSYVTTASPEKLTGTTAGVGKKAALGLEDPGIYVTPMQETSPYFLRLSKDIPKEYEFSANPLKGGIPTITRIKTKGVTRYPRDIINEPGFYEVSKYQQDILAGTGKVVITKRSEIGLGEIPSRKYIKQDPLTGEVLGKGREMGTSEIEAVIPVSAEFGYIPKSKIGKLKGFDYYTKYEGRNVAIRDAELILSGKGKAGKISKGSEIKKGSDYLYELTSTKRAYPSTLYYSGSKPTSSSKVSTSKSNVKRSRSNIQSEIYGYSSKISYSSQSNMIYDLSIPSSATSRVSGSSSIYNSASSILSGKSNTRSYSSKTSTGKTTYSQRTTSKISITDILNPGKRRPSKRKPVGFDVFVKIKGKYKQVNIEAYEKTTAKSRLAKFLESNAAASGYIQASKKKASKVRDRYIYDVMDRFYTKQKGGRNVLIERRRNRISTSGELNQITRLGIQSSKKRGWFF